MCCLHSGQHHLQQPERLGSGEFSDHHDSTLACRHGLLSGALAGFASHDRATDRGFERDYDRLYILRPWQYFGAVDHNVFDSFVDHIGLRMDPAWKRNARTVFTLVATLSEGSCPLGSYTVRAEDNSNGKLICGA